VTFSIPDRPCDIQGIPKKFREWRPKQKSAVEWLCREIESNHQFIALDAPTGLGKSLLAVATARLLGLKTIYVVSTKQLQQQLQADFVEAGAVVIWGRDNYPCIRFSKGSGITAASCTHRDDMPCPKYRDCPYKLAKRQALAADVAIVNYAFFLAEANFVGGFSGWPLVVLDEADLAETELLNFVSLELTRKQLQTCNLEPPQYKTKVDSWLNWAGPALKKVHSQVQLLDDEIMPYVENDVDPPLDLAWELVKYQRLEGKLRRFTSWVDETWVGEFGEDDWRFRPTFVRKQGGLLYKHSNKVLAMSATILSANDWGWNLGIEDKIAFYEVPSTFPKESRPLVYLPIADFSRKKIDDDALNMMTRAIDALLDKHCLEKGLIHTISYKLKDHILSHSRHKKRLRAHANASERSKALERFIASNEPLVLVSPSFQRGVDLWGDRARFQVIIKLPFPDLGDKQTSKRYFSGQSGKRWYALEAARNLIQMAGRIVRSANDYGVTYVLDERFRRFYQQMEADFPTWFKEAVIW